MRCNVNITHISEAWRIFLRSIRVKKYGVKKYKGTARQICKKIVDDCWNGKYFQVSSGHFCEFYVRDFGWSVDSLLKLGYRQKVLKTLDFVMSVYSEQGLTTTITPKGKCVDVFSYSPDSLAYLVRSLRVAKAHKLVEKYKKFLIKEMRKFESVISRKTGMVRTDRKFSSMKDQALRKSSTYNNLMVVMLGMELDKLGFGHGIDVDQIKWKIKEYLWNGEYFYDDMRKQEAVTGDSNIFPFFLGVFDDKKMLKSCIKSIRRVGLDQPFPLKYSHNNHKEHDMNLASWFTQSYEKDSIWMHMGPLYVSLVKKVDKKLAKKYKDIYTQLIEKHQNYLEIFNAQGEPFKTAFYYSDEGMLWAANYLTL